MKRLTTKRPDGSFAVDAAAVRANDDSTAGGAAIDRLGALEDIYEALSARCDELEARIDVLKAQGRARSASAQQLLAQKFAIQSTLSLMAPLEDAHGEDEN